MNLSLRLVAGLGLLTTVIVPVVSAQQAKPFVAQSPPEGMTQEQEDKPLPLLANGTTAPDFAGLDINDNPVKLSDLRGKVVVIDFWASWCAPCNVAMPHNQAVMQKLQAEGLPVVMLAVDNSDGREDFDAWVKPKRARMSALTFVYVSPTQDFNRKKFQVTGLPAQYVLDKNGVIRASFVNSLKPNNDLEKAVRAALRTSKPAKAATSAGKK